MHTLSARYQMMWEEYSLAAEQFTHMYFAHRLLKQKQVQNTEC